MSKVGSDKTPPKKTDHKFLNCCRHCIVRAVCCTPCELFEKEVVERRMTHIEVIGDERMVLLSNGDVYYGPYLIYSFAVKRIREILEEGDFNGNSLDL